MAYMGIPVGLDVGRRDRAKVVYDARDIYVDARNIARLPGPARRLFARVERGWAQHADRVITVNGPYADVMAVRFGVERPLVVLNCSLRAQAPSVRGRRFHEALGLPDDRRVVLYHGGLSRDRGIEQLLEAIPAIPDATLVLMGYGDLEATDPGPCRLARPGRSRVGPACRAARPSSSSGSRPPTWPRCRSSRPRSTTG